MIEKERIDAPSWMDRSISSIIPRLSVENVLAFLIILVAVFSRFYKLEARVMSHDEVNHVVPSWELYQGNGYRHDPVTHGPFQFHVVALSYFLLGDDDFSSRVPAAIFSTAAVAFVLFGFRRYLGRKGALVAGLLYTISPYMLFYGRYTRNEAFIELVGVALLFGLLRYLERGDRLSLFLVTITTSLHFCIKETAYIYTAQFLLFVGVLLLEEIQRLEWDDSSNRKKFAGLMLGSFALLGSALALAVLEAEQKAPPMEDAPSVLPGGFLAHASASPIFLGVVASLAAAIVIGIVAVVFVVRKLGWEKIRSLRSFNILILVGTLILPLLSAFPVKIVGWDPLDYSSKGIMQTGIFVLAFTIIATLIGLWWNSRQWLIHAVVFYAIFIVFYTTIFTNGQGFFTGLVGALGYWLSQQGVNRGEQPWYYYAAIQVPMYEYLAALGTFLAVYFGVRHRKFTSVPGYSPADDFSQLTTDDDRIKPHDIPTLSLLVFWSISSLIAYSIAGEKMPWLTVHIALPLIMAGGWGIGYLLDITPWKKIVHQRGLIIILLGIIFLFSILGVLGNLLGDNPPFQGKTLEQLQATSTFLLTFVAALASGGGLFYYLRDWRPGEILSLAGVLFFALLAVLTTRAAYMASFINYDNAREYLVYAHASAAPKEVLTQVEEISRRTTGGLDLEVAYDNDALYPYWWYLRDYPNKRWYTDKPTRDLKDVPVIIAGDTTRSKMDPIVKSNFNKFEYVRLWWPNQDYYNLTGERIWNVIKDPKMRAAIFDIWLNRDYRKYAALTNNANFTLENWQPSSRMNFYIRKDIISQIWNYGVASSVIEEVTSDPYEAGMMQISPDFIIGSIGSMPGQFNGARDIAAAGDNTVYVADTKNHRIQHFNEYGELLNTWGTFADMGSGNAPGGTFNEPWGIAVGPDGSVFVADTWNYRIQKFSPDGEFITMWGTSGQGESPTAFWGPRDVAVDPNGRVFVTDTGNKRIVVFDSNGQFLSQFGAAGMNLGELDEPVGIAVDVDGKVYVADTWNQRIQVFSLVPETDTFVPVRSIEFYGWFGQSIDNKPYLAVDAKGNVFVCDPEGMRVVEFDAQGIFVRAWGEFQNSGDGLSMPSGATADSLGRVWVTDAGSGRVMRFTMP